MLRNRDRLIYGVGVNDSDYITQPTVDGKRVTCPFYNTWKDMLRRCYSDKFQRTRPTYVGCTVHKEWLRFSTFKVWMETQPWEGNALDKDLLVKGNKIYSPETCAFVHNTVNNFISDNESTRGPYLLGCYLHKGRGKLLARCNNPFTKRSEYLGLFTEELSAHLAWKARKHELAHLLANSTYVTDHRVADALRVRYQ